jgi:hypothetical protein
VAMNSKDRYLERSELTLTLGIGEDFVEQLSLKLGHEGNTAHRKDHHWANAWRSSRNS